MVKITLEMSRVSKCETKECAYNVNQMCHAKAITIGDQVTPHCDTYCPAPTHTKKLQFVAGVGACKVSGCKWNSEYECTADKIQVGLANGEVRCLTYAEGRN